MKPPKFLALLTALLPAALLLSACNKSPDATTSDGKKKLNIAVIPKGTTHSYWKAAEAGARKAGEELGVNIEWQGPLDDSKIADQIGIFNNLAASGVDGIVLAPCDDKALLPHVRTVSKRGIPISIFDSPLAGKQGTDFVNLVATDNTEAGRIAYKQLAKVIGDAPQYGGKILMIRNTEGSASTRLREDGFIEAQTAAGKLQLVDKQFTDGSMAGSQRVAEALLGNYVKDGKLELDGIFASNQPTAEGTFSAIRGLRDKGVTVAAKFVGFDDSELLVQGVKKGEIDALIVQDPGMMGYLGVKSVVDHINKKPVEAYVDTGVTIKTQAGDSKP